VGPCYSYRTLSMTFGSRSGSTAARTSRIILRGQCNACAAQKTRDVDGSGLAIGAESAAGATVALPLDPSSASSRPALHARAPDAKPSRRRYPRHDAGAQADDDLRGVPRAGGEGRRAPRVPERRSVRDERRHDRARGAHRRAVSGALINALRERPCRVSSAELRIRIRATGLTTYPDVSVVCSKAEADSEDPHAIVNPVLVVEVLSESTEAYDRGEKAAHYRHLPMPARVRPRLAAPAAHRGPSQERSGTLGALRVREREPRRAGVRRVLHRRRRGLSRSAGGGAGVTPTRVSSGAR
jgi:hypothetical protein